MAKERCSVYVAMNEDGDYEVGTSSEEANERLGDSYGGEVARIVAIDVLMTRPQIETGPEVVISDDTDIVEASPAAA